ncbi:MAG TPA: hypothetical protein VD861_05415 [Pyrinomonadaceae bacterium]|nr:hypothetical protein [Pyrinomonadaceae bacterium]
MRAGVYFEAEGTDGMTEGDAFARTDEDGKFSIKVLKGLAGKLVGTVILNGGEFTGCPQIAALLKLKGEIHWREEKTDVVENSSPRQSRPRRIKTPLPELQGRGNSFCNKNGLRL